MKRLFWIGLGAAAGVLVARRVSRAAERLTPVGLSRTLGESLRELGDAVQYFAESVRSGAAEREAQLYDQLGVTADGRPATATPGERR